MHYIIDAYNLIFTTLKSPSAIQARREKAVEALSAILSEVHLPMLLVFDGDRAADEDTGFQYYKKFDAFFTPRGQSADEYIVEYLSLKKHRKQYTVVTSDKSLARECSDLGARIQSPIDFLNFLENKVQKKTKCSDEKLHTETDANMKRLQKAFEKRLKDLD